MRHLGKRLSTADTFTYADKSVGVKQVVISCPSAGSGWKVRVQDRDSPPTILIPDITLAPTPDAKLATQIFDPPVPMRGGIDVVTGGTPGVVNVWIAYG